MFQHGINLKVFGEGDRQMDSIKAKTHLLGEEESLRHVRPRQRRALPAPP